MSDPRVPVAVAKQARPEADSLHLLSALWRVNALDFAFAFALRSLTPSLQPVPSSFLLFDHLDSLSSLYPSSHSTR